MKTSTSAQLRQVMFSEAEHLGATLNDLKRGQRQIIVHFGPIGTQIQRLTFVRAVHHIAD